MGLEPTTCDLRSRYSAIELSRLRMQFNIFQGISQFWFFRIYTL